MSSTFTAELIEESMARVMARRNVKVPFAAEVLGVSRGKVYELMNSGKLPSVHIDGARRIPLDALEAYMDEIRGE